MRISAYVYVLAAARIDELAQTYPMTEQARLRLWHRLAESIQEAADAEVEALRKELAS